MLGALSFELVLAVERGTGFDGLGDAVEMETRVERAVPGGRMREDRVVGVMLVTKVEDGRAADVETMDRYDMAMEVVDGSIK